MWERKTVDSIIKSSANQFTGFSFESTQASTMYIMIYIYIYPLRISVSKWLLQNVTERGKDYVCQLGNARILGFDFITL